MFYIVYCRGIGAFEGSKIDVNSVTLCNSFSSIFKLNLQRDILYISFSTVFGFTPQNEKVKEVNNNVNAQAEQNMELWHHKK